MRLITRRIWRAFPELDRFDDERCRAFVRAATSRPAVAFVGWVVVISAEIAAFGFAGAVSIRAYERVQIAAKTAWVEIAAWAVAVVLFVLVGAIGVAAVLVARDFALRWAVRRVINTLGRCARCRYNLLGLPIEGVGTVTCPECGRQAEVSPAVATLSIANDGTRRLEQINAPPERRPFWTPVRRRRAKRWATGLAYAAVICGVGWIGWWWIGLLAREREAKVAQSERISPAMWEELRLKHYGPRHAAEKDAAVIINAVGRAMTEAESEARDRLPPEIDGAYPYYLWYLDETRSYRSSNADIEQLLGRAVLAELASQGRFAEMRAISSIPINGWRPAVNTSECAYREDVSTLTTARRVGDLNLGRMQLAIETDDPGAFAEAMETNLAIARFAASQNALTGWWVSRQIDSRTLERVGAAIVQARRAEWLDAIESALAHAGPRPDIRTTLDADKHVMLDVLAWVYGQATELEVRRATGWLTSGHVPAEQILGTYEQNRNECVVRSRVLAEQLPREARDRDWAALAWLNDREWRLLARTLLRSYQRMYWEEDIGRLDRAWVATALALQRHLLARGEYPPSFDQLDARVYAGLPLDTWSGKPLGYRRIDPKSDPQGRGYLLYSVGADQQDDGGVGSGGPGVYWHGALRPGVSPGTDYIINDWNRDR